MSALDLFDSIHGSRENLAEHGILFNVNVTVDGGYNLTGGDRAGGYVAGLLTATLQLDTEAMLGLKGGRFQLCWQSYVETNPRPYNLVPDYWGYESIASGIGDLNQVSICYYEQTMLDGKLAVRFGKQDALDVFLAPLGASAYFISNIDTYPAATVPYMPTYPDQAMGLVLVGHPTEWLDLKTAWFDGTNAHPSNGSAPHSTGSLGPATFFSNPGSWFFISEFDVKWERERGLEGVLGVGGWWQTGSSTVVAPNTPPNQQVSDFTGGWYAQVTQRIYNPDPESEVRRGVIVFSQFGAGDPSTNPVEWSLSAGLVFNGPLPGRDSDSVGAAIGYSSFSDDSDLYEGTGGLYELVVEVYYNIAITNWMSIQPDIQVLTTPLGGSELPTAVIGILRLSVNF